MTTMPIFGSGNPGRFLTMPHYLLLGAGFSRNWGALSEEITGSLLSELHDDAELARTLRQGPFEFLISDSGLSL